MYDVVLKCTKFEGEKVSGGLIKVEKRKLELYN